MKTEQQKMRPINVPKENVYNHFHWTLALALLAAIATVYAVVSIL